ncbi:hypothetical protein SARC_04719 [Sphaeroforma arctica JP610]|uniref:EGF-like domain-containing protein n=1 Tax=Sphaeroforma arctica JP610 TaxID=667725 RepID=A0A0L0G2E2_9EUKA|nr:hypothetical protein SARC_04719 [Sphaeroforma arctica JP610]KNC82996.1 hypothetical protein SARC_04719 [Sphaeroforma arctica JP610]|eukprot:XP_014156898.1 hypothetical protein SARC_04719 [Sphaeroforma arctica JP610]
MPGLDRVCLLLATLVVVAYNPAQGTADCTVNGINLVNYDDLCMCHSSWGGATCLTQHTTPENCATWDDAADMPGDVTIGATVADAVLEYGASDSITWTAVFPVSDGREYTQVKLGDCVDGTDFFTFLSTSTSGECTDKLAVGIKAVDMDNCNFAREAVSYNGKEYWNMSSVLEFTYTDPTAAGGEDFDRSVTTVFAVHALFESRFEATVADIAVYSNFEMVTAITLQAITEGQASSFVELTYGLSHPYQVQTIQGGLTVTGGSNTATLRTEADGGGTAVTGLNLWTAPECEAGQYNNNNNQCLKTAYVEILHGQCTLAGAYTLEAVTIYCLDSLPVRDCPLAAPDSDTTITFNLDSADFCDGNEPSVTRIDSAVAIDRFIFVDPENRIRGEGAWLYVDDNGVTQNKPSADTAIESLLWGGTVFARVDFSGLAVTDVQVQTTETKLGDDPYVAIPTDFTIAGAVVPGTDFVINRDPVQDFTGKCATLGFCALDQTVLLKHTVGAGMHAGLTADVGLGVFETMTVRIVLDVTYETDQTFSARRRRRQASADGEPAPPTRTDGNGAGMVTTPPVAISASDGSTVANMDEGDNDSAASASTTPSVLLALVCAVAGFMSS